MWLAIDPGIRNTGWAVMNESEIHQVGLIQTVKGADVPAYLDNPRRCKELWSGIDDALIYAPSNGDSSIPIHSEGMGGSKSARALVMLAMAQAVVASVAADWGSTHHVMLPMKVKEIVCGNRKASKEDIIRCVKELYPEAEGMIFESVGKAKARQEHIYDAIAIGWAIYGGFDMTVIGQKP